MQGAANQSDGPDAWLVLSGIDHIEVVSQTALEFLRTPPARLIGADFRRWVIPEDREPLAAALDEARARGRAGFHARLRPLGRSPRARRLDMLALDGARVRVSMESREEIRARKPAAGPAHLEEELEEVAVIAGALLPRSDVVRSCLEVLTGPDVSIDLKRRAHAAIARECELQDQRLRELLDRIAAMRRGLR